MEGVAGVQARLESPQDQVAQPRGDAAVEQEWHARLLGERREPECVLREERDVDQRTSRAENLFRGAVAQEPGHGPDDQVGILDGLRHRLRRRQIGDDAVRADVGETLDPYRVHVDHQDRVVVLRDQIPHDGAAHAASTQHDDLQLRPPR